MFLRNPCIVIIVFAGVFGCVDQYGNVELPYEPSAGDASCEKGFLPGPDGNCWPITEDDGRVPAADIWAWSLSPENGGSCRYGDEYEPEGGRVHLEVGRSDSGFALFDTEGGEFPCEVDGARFRCEDVVVGTMLHANVDVDMEFAVDQTSLTFEGVFTTTTTDGVFTRAAGTYSRTHSCRGYQCDELEEDLGPDFAFPCRGLGGFSSQLADR